MNLVFKQTVIFCLVFCGFLFSANLAVACSCAEAVTVDKEFVRAKNVVILKAISILGEPKTPAKPDERVSGFNFVVDKVFKGKMNAGDKIQMIATGMCSLGFRAQDLGSEFLVYYWDDDMFSIFPGCNRSGHAKWRAADISYLENVRKVKRLTRISGMITQSFDYALEGESSSRFPLSKHLVRIIGNGRDIRLNSDEQGVYEVYGLPPGQYRIEPERINGYQAIRDYLRKTDSATISLGTQGHAEMDFSFEIDNVIAGKLLDPDGKPISHIMLELLPAHGKARQYWGARATSFSEDDGSFKFEDVPPGTYIIVGNSKNEMTRDNPYPTFYSPGIGDRMMATEIRIGPGEVVKDILINIPKLTPEK